MKKREKPQIYTIEWNPYPEKEPDKQGEYLVSFVSNADKAKPSLKKLCQDITPEGCDWKQLLEIPDVAILYYFDPQLDDEYDDSEETGWCFPDEDLTPLPDTLKVTGWAKIPPPFNPYALDLEEGNQ